MTIVEAVASDLRGPLRLLEGWMRAGEPVTDDFVRRLRASVEAGDVDVLAAREGERAVGVLVLAYRLNVSLGGLCASIEDLYVVPEARRRGVGRALLETAGERCAARGISYVEVQVEGEEAADFYGALGYQTEPDVRVMSRSLPLDRVRGVNG